MLLWWTEKIPYVSDPDNLGGIFYLGPYLNLLPLIAVSLMIVQQKIMTPPPTDEQQEMQQKMMKYMMVFFGILFYKVASGLCIYFISSSLWGLAELPLPPQEEAGERNCQPPAVRICLENHRRTRVARGRAAKDLGREKDRARVRKTTNQTARCKKSRIGGPTS